MLKKLLLLVIVCSVFLVSPVFALTGIINCTELQNMDNNLTEDYQLSNNIDCSATSGWNSGTGFSPVGNTTTQFTGTFDGQGYNISDLFINRTSINYQALFGYVNGVGTSISNVGLENIFVSGADYTAGLVGRITDTSVNNTFVTGEIIGNDNVGGIIGYVISSTNPIYISNSYTIVDITGNDYVGGAIGNVDDNTIPVIINNVQVLNSEVTANAYSGGLVGFMGIGNITNSYVIGNVTTTGGGVIGGLIGVTNWANSELIIIDNCSYSGTMIGAGANVGGIIGASYDDNTYIDNSYSEGEIIAVGGSAGGFAYDFYGAEITDSYSTMDVLASTDVGGLVGYLQSGSLIDKCYTTGFINSSGENVGGLVGFNEGGTINNSYATGNVVSGSRDVGGLVGQMNGGVIENSYSTGTVDGATLYGGLLGTLSAGSCASSYWDTETSSEPTSACGDGKTTVEMQTLGTFTSWDAVECEEGYTFVMRDYPCLFNIDVNCSCQEIIDESNYSIVGGYLIAEDDAGELGENITITYLYQQVVQGESGQVISETTESIAGVTSWFNIFIVIGAMVVLIFLVIIIIVAINGSGLMSEGGA